MESGSGNLAYGTRLSRGESTSSSCQGWLACAVHQVNSCEMTQFVFALKSQSTQLYRLAPQVLKVRAKWRGYEEFQE